MNKLRTKTNYNEKRKQKQKHKLKQKLPIKRNSNLYPITLNEIHELKHLYSWDVLIY